jgi:ABC-type sugar transport system substrate-binding protein
MTARTLALGAALLLTASLPIAAMAQPGLGWPGGGPGPYSPYAAGQYGAGNPYAQELNDLAVKNPAKHDACFDQANQKSLRRDARWKFMIGCMKE